MSDDDNHNQSDHTPTAPCSTHTPHPAHYYIAAIYGIGPDGPVPSLSCVCPGVSS